MVAVDEPRAQAAAPLAPPPELSIPYQDEHLLVVDKPAGRRRASGARPPRGHAGAAPRPALAGGEDPERRGVVHRLDRDTSGLLVVARTEEAHRALREALRPEMQREYLALVKGGLPPARGRSTLRSAATGADGRGCRSTPTTRARRVTHFEIERALPTSTLLRVRLETGRTHQIRAHLLAIGHPVAGDPEYGNAGRFGLERQFLHAARSRSTPGDGRVGGGQLRLPADLRAALERAATAAT